ncbi:MAG: S-methyl-5-thioribose-1-phosphate isomerase [Candidatus Micrarchaeota archaeon]
MHKDVQKTIKDIKNLKIQGARNVAREAVRALISEVKSSKTRSAAILYRDIVKAADALAASRPTEPMMRNLLENACRFARNRKDEVKGADALRKDIIKREEGILEGMKDDKRKLSEYGAKLIPNNALVITHCHSSSVTGILIKAKRMRKKFSVISLETRPRYQGRLTATELAENGIDVTTVVDGAMNMVMKKADIVLVGADSISSRGDLINKVGTSTLAHIARMHDTSFYSCAELLKYSSETIHGSREKIEERDHKEVWENPPKKVKISNPAFDVTSAKYINGYVTEVGVLPTQSFFAIATQKLGINIYR